jgi:hypothetical protein
LENLIPFTSSTQKSSTKKDIVSPPIKDGLKNLKKIIKAELWRRSFRNCEGAVSSS